MLKTRMKRIADHQAAAARTIALIEASVVALSDDDLLDLADIFSGASPSPLGRWRRRKWRSAASPCKARPMVWRDMIRTIG